jgi:hypothetical protein
MRVPPDDDTPQPLDSERVGTTPFDQTAPPATPPRGPIIALRAVGQNVQLELTPAQERFTLGAAPFPVVDLTLDGETVSRVHAVLVRKGNKLRVLDRSTNGTFYRGHRDPDFEIASGDIFEVSRRVKLIALDQHLLILRNRMLWVLGLRAHLAADLAVEAIATNAPLLLVGPPGCEQRLIAEEIHRRSPFCDRDFVVAPPAIATHEEQAAILAHGRASTIYLDLSAAKQAPPEGFATRAFEHSRPIIAATSEDHAARMIGPVARRLHVIRLAPPAERRDDIPRLLDALIAQEHAARGASGELLPLAALGERNIERLKDQPWPGHFDDLRYQVPRLHALLSNGAKLRRAAEALGLQSPGSLSEALGRIGIKLRDRGEDGPSEAGDEDGGADEPPIPPGALTPPPSS